MPTKKQLQEKIETLEFQNESLKTVLQYQKNDIAKLETELANFSQYRIVMNNIYQNRTKAYQEDAPYAFYYKKLVKVIEDTPAIQSEWERFMTYVKLSCSEDEIRQLGG